MGPRSLRGSTLLALGVVWLTAAIAGATDVQQSGVTCQICDNPTFVACNPQTASSPRCAGAKGNELRVFCPAGTVYTCTLKQDHLGFTCANPKLRYGVDQHGNPDKTQNVLSCS